MTGEPEVERGDLDAAAVEAGVTRLLRLGGAQCGERFRLQPSEREGF